MNENDSFICQKLSLGVDNQTQIKFLKLKMSLLFKGLLNMLHFFYSPGMYEFRVTTPS